MQAEITMISPKKNKLPITAPIMMMMVVTSHLLSKGSSIIYYGLILFKGGGVAQRQAEFAGAQEPADDLAGAGFG